MKKLSFLVLLAFIAGGCSKVYQIQFPENAKKLLEEKNGALHLAEDQCYETDRIHVFGDSVAFRDKKTDSLKTVALRDISHVERLSRSLALSQGAALTLAIVGSEYVGLSAFSHRPHAAQQGVGPYILGGTLIGCVLGTLIHSKAGSRETYIFNRDSLIAHSGEIEKQEAPGGDKGPEIKKVVKFGIELGNYLAGRSGSFSNMLGYSTGFLTGINLYSDERSQYALGIDVSYNKIIDYRTRITRDYVFMEGYKYHYVNDERYELTFAELGVFPEYLYAITENLTVGFYGGASIGLGTEYLTVNELSRTMTDSTYYHGADYGPYGEYNISPCRLPYCFSIGSSMYYMHLMIDLKYRYTNMNAEYSYVKEFHNLYLQLGFVL